MALIEGITGEGREVSNDDALGRRYVTPCRVENRNGNPPDMKRLGGMSLGMFCFSELNRTLRSRRQ